MVAVEEEALVGVEVELADAEGDGFVIDGFAVLQDGRYDCVQGGVVEVPAIGIRDGRVSFEVGSGAWREGERLRDGYKRTGQRAAVWSSDGDGQPDIGTDIGVVCDRGSNVNGGGLS